MLSDVMTISETLGQLSWCHSWHPCIVVLYSWNQVSRSAAPPREEPVEVVLVSDKDAPWMPPVFQAHMIH